MSQSITQGGAAEQEVRQEDQQRINTFNKLNTRLHELQAGVKAKKSELEDLEDAGNELMLLDDDQVRFVVGESFYHAGTEETEEQLQEVTSGVEQEISTMNKELLEIQETMAALKKELYGRFGNSINLEE
ncbi:hypothetical protein WJX79_000685 [Trebouxia sp. C0005]|nr:MAG: putative prefoldin subunit 4-like [Trebouxia sp. A1-2]